MDSQVEEIKNRLDIVELVSEYVKLHKAGTNYKAPCPFHREKVPSFMVSQDKQIFHCFGCGAGGDVFAFIQKIENCEFPEALRLLAKKANVELKTFSSETHSDKTRVLDILKLSAKFYHKSLLESKEGEMTRGYLAERKVKNETIDDFVLGYAPESWDVLYNFLKAKNFSDDLIFKSGLVVERATGARRYYDRFRRRLMFPIRDVHGQIVGFTGRVLPGAKEEEGGKYVNTPQTIAYNKSYILFNLDLAKQYIKKADYTILVEGNMDAISLWQEGVKNAVCVSGTALTEPQTKLLKRYSPNIILGFDMDTGGERALERGIEQALKEEMNIKVLVLPFGKDPDECIKKDKKAFLAAVKESKLIMDYLFEKTLSDKDLKNVKEKKQAAFKLLPWIKRIANRVEQTHYLQLLANKISVSEETLREEMGKIRSGGQESIPEEKSADVIKKTRFEVLSERILSFLLRGGERPKNLIEAVDEKCLVGRDNKELYRAMLVYYNKEKKIDSKDFIQYCQGQAPKLAGYANILLLLEEDENEEKEILENILVLKKNHLEDRIRALEMEIKEAESLQDKETINKLTSEFSLLTQSLKDLK